MMNLVDAYIALRRASGFKVERSERHLRSFARFAEARGEPHIQMETAIAWAATARSPGARNAWLSSLAIFARHLHLEDPRHQVPSAAPFPHKQGRRLPHLYSPDEIEVLLKAAGKLSRRGSSRPATYQTLLGLLVVTGMRISEALRLTMADVTDAGLIIRETKFRKSRLLPLHDSARAALDRYRDRWRSLAQPGDPLFATAQGDALRRNDVTYTFRRLTRRVGMRGAKGTLDTPSAGPHLHDFRHTFAVRSLEECPSEHHAIGKHMTALTTYLGHAALVSTCWYLHASPTLMTGIADACEALDEGDEP